MGSAVSVGLDAAIKGASDAEMGAICAGLSGEDRKKVLLCMSGPVVKSLAPGKLYTAFEVLNAIHGKKVSCSEVVEKSLARISATEEELMACPEVLAQDARVRAKAVDEKIAKGEALGPLEGLPIVIKINVDIAGTLSTASNPVLDGWRPTSTAPICKALLDAGAIVVAKTNMPLMARVAESLSPLHGKCRNPLNLSHSPAGSSSGTAASIAAGIVSCGIGSDTGGSCRIPAICCGITGFRPSPGRYSIDGIVPCVGPADTAGPLAVSVRDIMLLDEVITGTKHETGPATADTLKGMRMATPADWIADDGFKHKTNKVSWDAITSSLSEKGVEFVKDAMGRELLFKHSFVNITKNSWRELDDYLEAHRRSGAEHVGIKASTREFVEKTGAGEEKFFRPPGSDAEKEAADAEGLKAATRAAEEAIAAYFAATGAKFLLTPGAGCLPYHIDDAEQSPGGTIDQIVGRKHALEDMYEDVGPTDNFNFLIRYCLRFAGLLTSIAIPTPIRCQATGLPTGLILWALAGSDQELLQAAAAVEAAVSAIDASKYIVSY